MEIELLSKENVTINSLDDFERTHHVTRVYRKRNGQILAFISLKRELVDGYLILKELYVSTSLRGQGIGKSLFSYAIKEARTIGAKEIYISACSSEETIGFYKAIG